MSMTFEGFGGVPGIDDARNTIESEIQWGGHYPYAFLPLIIDGASVDAGGSPTTILRPGLLMGKVTATKKAKQWNPAAADGTENILGPLVQAHRSTRYGVASDLWTGWIMVQGRVKSARLIVPGNASASIIGDSNEYTVRGQMRGRFLFDDEVDKKSFMRSAKAVVAKTANYTVLPADNGTFFSTLGAAGAVTFTLPAPLPGLHYTFFNAVDQNMTVAAAANSQMIAFNDAAANSIAFSTASEKVGACVEVLGLSTSKWAVIVSLGAETQTPTIAT